MHDVPRIARGLALASGLVFVCTTALAADKPARKVDFNRDVRPILSDTCFQCHGPDDAAREADLRLDLREGMFAAREGHATIVPGDSAKSELFRRITSTDKDAQMPPADAKRKLSPEQIETLRRWIDEGAAWEDHWAFVRPRRPLMPVAQKADGVRNAIDALVLKRLDQEGLEPSPEADRQTLIRRVTLDLTGLPPTPNEVDTFISDESPNAYEKVVDRLLASPRYGERVASRWLDAARYADTCGYQTDGDRDMWRWRDWVIDTLNAGMPFDQFTIEQLAGDMLPNPTLEQQVATGFNRNHRGNGEGGIIPEEFAVEYVVDRVETTATVWMGLTMGCTRCHDHKYDPLRQKEFYKVYAFFNNIPEKGKAVKVGNSPPMIPAPTPDDQRALATLDRELEAARHEWNELQPALAASQADWERAQSAGLVEDWSPTDKLSARYDLDGAPKESSGIVKADSAFKEGGAAFQSGRIGQAADFDGKRFIDAGDVADFGYYDKFSTGAWIYPRKQDAGTVLSRMVDVDTWEGWSIRITGGKAQILLVKRWLDDSLRVESAASLEPDRWHHVFFTYDGSRVAAGIKLYIDGQPAETVVKLDELNQSFQVKEPLRIGGGHGPKARFVGLIDDVRIYNKVLSPNEIALVAETKAIADILALPPDKRNDVQSAKLRACYLARFAPEPMRAAQQRIKTLEERRKKFVESFPTVMVMQEMPERRPAYILARGQYDKPTEQVLAGVPAALPPMKSTDANPSRLDFARWLVSPENPLTPRVAANRAWQMFFGAGLVRTMEDFGSQGERPSHPELLDWLATELQQTGWDVKGLHRLIVTSATYRQSSRMTKTLHDRDPDNRLLSRGPRVRLSAEMIRDQALFASGLLVEKLGGPSVKPYQPPGLWTELTGSDYKPDTGLNLYRRSLYTFWKRTVTPPTMSAFDASPRETCVVRETRTNTPLQALALMNDVTFVEASRVLAERVMSAEEMGSETATPSARIARAFQLVTGRIPEADELRVLTAAFESHRQNYASRAEDAKKLACAGESPREESADPASLAAYTTIANLIFNLDEAITKE